MILDSKNIEAIEKLDKRRLLLESQKLAVKPFSEEKSKVEEISREVIGSMENFEDVLLTGSVQEKKERMRAFVSHIEVDKSNNTVTCFVRKIPETQNGVNFLYNSDLQFHRSYPNLLSCVLRSAVHLPGCLLFVL
jgi:hypothetical protein